MVGFICGCIRPERKLIMAREWLIRMNLLEF